MNLEHVLPTNHPRSETTLFFDLELVTARITPAMPSSAFARVVAARTRRGCGDEPTSVLMAAHQAILSSQDGVTGFETRTLADVDLAVSGRGRLFLRGRRLRA